MAKAKRNLKTHPKPTGDDAQDDFIPPDRQDQLANREDAGRTEVVDVFGKAETVDTGVRAEGDGVDVNSATEGDARSMASENDGAGEEEPTPRRTRTERESRQHTTSDDDEGGYGARVRKRIARERALVNRERALREQTQRALDEERAARQATDERIARLERATTEVAQNAGVKDLENQIATLKPQLAAAMEAGETAKALDIQDKLSDLKAKLEVVKYDLAQRARAAEAAAAAARSRTTTTTTEADKTTEIDPDAAASAAAFKKANRHWWNRTANKEAKEDAVTIDREILQEIQDGELDFEPYSDEHWEEVAHRLHEAYPHLEIQDLDGQPYNFDDEEQENMNQNDRRNGGKTGRQQNGRQQGNRAPTRGMGQNGRKSASDMDLARQGKVTLDQDDFATMRLFKMDPNNPNDKKYFAKEKMRSILTGQRDTTGGNR
ncbi:MAG TPA: hypothetical protein VLH80_07390 [Nitrospiraceae bacterium]|nr:hypothetical protein [Nitrospiraceae bacterium]